MTKKIINDQLWIEKRGTTFRVGLTNQGREDFGKITFALFPKIGQSLVTDETLVELEAEKAVTDLLMPLSGTVVAVNEDAVNDPAVLDNTDETLAWLVDLEDVKTEEFESLN